MAKNLEDILNESGTPVEDGVDPTTAVEATDVAAEDEQAEVNASVVVPTDDIAPAVVEGADDVENADDKEPAQQDASADADGPCGRTPAANEEPGAAAEAVTCEASVPQVIQLRRRITLYRDAACTKPVGTHSGTIRVLFPNAKNVSLAEYTVVSAGKRITKRAYIHI